MNLKKFLKPIKKRLHYNKDHPFRTIRHLYSHLSELTNEEILDYYNVTTITELSQHLNHIKKILQQKIENYQEELTEIDACFCLDAKKEFKYLYPTKKEAQKQIEFAKKTKRIKLALYPCPYHCGWHLHRI